MAQSNLGPTELGRRIGVTKQDISRWAKGERKLPPAAAADLAPHLNTTAAALLLLPEEPAVARTVPVVSWVSAGRLRASHPVFESDILRYIDVTDLPAGDWLALEVDGDSMDRIAPPGSTIVLNRRESDLVDGRYYVFGNEQGEATFKRYRSNPDRLQPFSTNPDHETHYLQGEMMTVGRVRRVITNI
ncbi:phage repressor protein [Methylobacterium terrae]|uniref:Phage repressor protein n=2 Tax=Methylobacterium terrae TaxID=2202827 RepID=A0A2U8WM14_9HYPH|nr:phage repressor protein [Methylobacterium terrae]